MNAISNELSTALDGLKTAEQGKGIVLTDYVIAKGEYKATSRRTNAKWEKTGKVVFALLKTPSCHPGQDRGTA